MKPLLFVCLILCCGLRGLGQQRMVVAQDGSGDFRTVQAALDAVPLGNEQPVTIFIRNGVYREKLRLDSSKNGVTLVGEDKFRTRLTFDDHAGRVTPRGDTINTYTSASFFMLADGFSAEHLTFENAAGFTAGQAVAVQVGGDRAAFRHCRFLGHQDVLFVSRPGGRLFFADCYIEGTTDFIFGAATAWFQGCHIHSKKNSHITAASTPQGSAHGFVFYDCVLTAEPALSRVSLGRPWRPHASVSYLYCYLGPHILPAGWDNWRDPANETTARYSEYQNWGAGARPANRLPWTHQLAEPEALRLRPEAVLGSWVLPFLSSKITTQ